MSLKVNQIKAKLRSLFEQDLDLSDLSKTDAERDAKVLSRCLAAMAVYLKTGCSPKEAAESVWDGTDDNGIDAAFFDISNSQVVFVQSKWIAKGSGEPEAKEIRTFVQGVRDAIEQDQASFHVRLHGRFNDISHRLSMPGTSVHLVLVTTGASSLSKHGTDAINKFLIELNGESEPIASSEVIGLSEVYTGLATDQLQGNVTVEGTILEWSYISTPYPAYFGMIDGAQLKSWWKASGKALLAQNIRHSLGATEVNKDIMQTATAEPEKFWYFNNGITLVADEAIKAPAGASSRVAGVFSFKGASIVNGAQTVSSLAKVEKDASLGNVRVPLRVILLKSAPEGFGSEVTRTNNFQNRIEPRDFVAQDPEQRRLRQEMAIEGIEYQFVRTEDATASGNTACELVEVTTALACASGDPGLAVQVKTGISRIFNDLTKAPYKTLFNPSVSGAQAFNATIAHRAIEGWIEKQKQIATKRSGPSWGILVHGNRILAASVFKKMGTGILSKPIAEFPAALGSVNLDKLCASAYKSMVDGAEQHFPGKFLAVLFKNPTMSKKLFDLATAK